MTTTHIRTPGSLTQADASARVPIGTPWTDQDTWKRYCYVYNAGTTSWTIGVPVGIFLTATTYGECSFTAATQLLINDGTTDVTAVAGIALGTVATTQFGWIQVGGICTNVVTDGTLEASCAGYVADNGVATIISTEPTAHGIFCVGITADVGNLSSNVLLFDCVLDHH
jgi:hypothetical protein